MSDDVSRETELGDPSVALSRFAGDRMDLLRRFAEMTAEEGVLRGLIGPREVPRLWGRHIENSAALLTAMPMARSLIDVGSGGGFPGIVAAILRPEMATYLVEPMERRTTWLREVRAELGLENVEVYRGRSEEFFGSLSAEVVTARAVARLDKLARWCMPLVDPGGELVVLKGSAVHDELGEALPVLKRLGAVEWSVVDATLPSSDEVTQAVRVCKTTEPVRRRRG